MRIFARSVTELAGWLIEGDDFVQCFLFSIFGI